MLKYIKQIYSDLTEFFLVLLTGVFAGSIFTFAYVKYDVKTTLSFADIGGMLAGVGTIGVLLVAYKTTDSWRTQLLSSKVWEVQSSPFLGCRLIISVAL